MWYGPSGVLSFPVLTTTFTVASASRAPFQSGFRTSLQALETWGPDAFPLPVESPAETFVWLVSPNVVRAPGLPAAAVPAYVAEAAGLPAVVVPVCGVRAAGLPAVVVPACGVCAAGLPAAAVPACVARAAGLPAAVVPDYVAEAAGLPAEMVPECGVRTSGGLVAKVDPGVAPQACGWESAPAISAHVAPCQGTRLASGALSCRERPAASVVIGASV
jgi:hypothetical protein